MTIEEFIKIINNKSMYTKQTNIRLIETKKGSRTKKSKRLTTRDLVLQLAIKLDNFIVKQEKFNQRQETFNQKQEKFNKEMLDFKAYVINQFKKHGWTK